MTTSVASAIEVGGGGKGRCAAGARPKKKSVSIYARLRRVMAWESGELACRPSKDSRTIIYRSVSAARKSAYDFTKVFQAQDNNSAVFEQTCVPLLHSVLDGFNAILIAYGQTGSGKTHSIMGSATAKSTPKSKGSASRGARVQQSEEGSQQHKGTGLLQLSIEHLLNECRKCQLSEALDTLSDDVLFGDMSAASGSEVSDLSESSSKLKGSRKKKAKKKKENVIEMSLWLSAVEVYGKHVQKIEIFDLCDERNRSNERWKDKCGSTTLDVKHATEKMCIFGDAEDVAVLDTAIGSKGDKKRAAAAKTAAAARWKRTHKATVSASSAALLKAAATATTESKMPPPVQVSDIGALLSEIYRSSHFAPTGKNPQSSRGHCVYIVTVVRTLEADATDSGGPKPRTTSSSNFVVVDLAGSEGDSALNDDRYLRATPVSEVTERRLEAGCINVGLSQLEHIFQRELGRTGASGKGRFVRSDLKITKKMGSRMYAGTGIKRSLYYFLDQNTHISVLFTLSPSVDNSKSTLSTLRFAESAALVKVRPVRSKVKALASKSKTPLAAVSASKTDASERPDTSQSPKRKEKDLIIANLRRFLKEQDLVISGQRLEIEELQQRMLKSLAAASTEADSQPLTDGTATAGTVPVVGSGTGVRHSRENSHTSSDSVSEELKTTDEDYLAQGSAKTGASHLRRLTPLDAASILEALSALGADAAILALDEDDEAEVDDDEDADLWQVPNEGRVTEEQRLAIETALAEENTVERRQSRASGSLVEFVAKREAALKGSGKRKKHLSSLAERRESDEDSSTSIRSSVSEESASTSSAEGLRNSSSEEDLSDLSRLSSAFEKEEHVKLLPTKKSKRKKKRKHVRSAHLQSEQLDSAASKPFAELGKDELIALILEMKQESDKAKAASPRLEDQGLAGDKRTAEHVTIGRTVAGGQSRHHRGGDVVTGISSGSGSSMPLTPNMGYASDLQAAAINQELALQTYAAESLRHNSASSASTTAQFYDSQPFLTYPPTAAGSYYYPTTGYPATGYPPQYAWTTLQTSGPPMAGVCPEDTHSIASASKPLSVAMSAKAKTKTKRKRRKSEIFDEKKLATMNEELQKERRASRSLRRHGKYRRHGSGSVSMEIEMTPVVVTDSSCGQCDRMCLRYTPGCHRCCHRCAHACVIL